MKIKFKPNVNYNFWGLYLILGQFFAVIATMELHWTSLVYAVAGVFFSVLALLEIITIEKG